MGKDIEVYIKRHKMEEYGEVLVQVDPGHACAHWHGSCGTAATIAPTKKHVLPEEHKALLEITEALAKDKELRLKTYDVSTLVGKLRARLKGINETPTVIIGNKKISGEITKNRLEKELEYFF